MIELASDEEAYSFGRGRACSYSLDHEALTQHPMYPSFSKKHFELTRTEGVNGAPPRVTLTDHSSNGTFINGTRVGERSRLPVNVSLLAPRNRPTAAPRHRLTVALPHALP